MVSLFGWFRNNKDEDYETILAALAMNIEKRRLRLGEIRRRESRASALVTLYALVAWVVYVTLWYVGALPLNLGGKAGRAGGVIGGPILILLMRRVVGVWYTRSGDAEEKTLQKLMREQRAKVDEIKKKTNWYETRELMQRYDEQGAAQTPPRKPATSTMPGGVQTPLTTPRPAPLLQGNAPPQPPPPAPIQFAASPQPQRKTWFDRLADVVVGDTDDTARYALICEECFGHNGLVKESEWETIQYRCPKCNHFNPARAKAQPPISPTSPSRPSPIPQRTVMASSAVSPSPLRHRVPSSPGDDGEKMEVDG
ncbi:hypothetical protein BDZ89DRAFT_996329 [Hymenopellis radicata]|nr:hypothetical protein BDZ89DRAFT_996329 [Hymenopellis radicata]